MELIQHLNKLAHLSPDQIVSQLHDPISDWICPSELTDDQIARIRADNDPVRLWYLTTWAEQGSDYQPRIWSMEHWRRRHYLRDYYLVKSRKSFDADRTAQPASRYRR